MIDRRLYDRPTSREARLGIIIIRAFDGVFSNPSRFDLADRFRGR